MSRLVSVRTPIPGTPLHERERLAEALHQSGGNLAAAARLLGMSRSGLRHRLHTYGLTRPSRHQAFPQGEQETGGREMPPPRIKRPTVALARRAEPPGTLALVGRGIARSGISTSIRTACGAEEWFVYRASRRLGAEARGRAGDRGDLAGAVGGRQARTPLLGRAHELSVLQAVLAQVEGGRGQVVVMVGEPGIGKSRLLGEWHQSLTALAVTSMEGHCWSYGSATPYLPVLDLLRAQCGIRPADRAEVIMERVRRELDAVGLAPEEWAPYLLHLLGVLVGTEQLADVGPERLKAKTFEALRQLGLRRSQQQPFVLAVEDLQWIDPTSDAWLTSLVECLPGAAMEVGGHKSRSGSWRTGGRWAGAPGTLAHAVRASQRLGQEGMRAAAGIVGRQDRS
jgi:hypothetical protein